MDTDGAALEALAEGEAAALGAPVAVAGAEDGAFELVAVAVAVAVAGAAGLGVTEAAPHAARKAAAPANAVA